MIAVDELEHALDTHFQTQQFLERLRVRNEESLQMVETLEAALSSPKPPSQKLIDLIQSVRI